MNGVRGGAGLALVSSLIWACAPGAGQADSGSGPGKTAAPSRAAPAPLPSRPVRPAQLVLAGEITQGGWARGVAREGVRALELNGASVGMAADGAFVIAFDRDAGPLARLVARMADGTSQVREIAVSPRKWQIEHVAVGPRPGALPSEEFKRRRAGELALINAARTRHYEVDGWRQKFIWPVTGRLSGLFGSQRIYRGTPGSYHSGTDVTTGVSGTPFVAPADGVVILAAGTPFTLEGRLLMIDHGMGLNSAFLHCSELLVREGDRVRQGQVIGRIGMTGRATGPHLHWSMKWGPSRVDPLLFAGPMPSTAISSR